METDFKKTLHKKLSFPILILMCLALLSFQTKDTESDAEENNTLMEQQITIVITKKTTKEELEKIKKQMTDEGLGFKYSNVSYNDKNEIVGISIYYKDLNNNSGNYSVSSQNPINNIVIVSEGTRISVKSQGSSNQAFINQGSGEQNSENTETSVLDRRKAMKERSDQMEKEMQDRMQAMKDRHAQRQAQMQKRSDSILNQSSSSTEAFNGNSHIITKNTSDSELLELQKIFESENISFYYKNLQRNSKDEITQISITIDNQNGSISTSGFGNGNNAIKDITLAVDKQHTIMKSAE